MDLEKEDSYESVADNGVMVFNRNSGSSVDLLIKNENESDGFVDIVKQMSGVDRFDNEVNSNGDFMSKNENESDGFFLKGQVKKLSDADRFAERVLEKEGILKNSSLDSSPGDIKEDSYESVADNEVMVFNRNLDSNGNFLIKNENDDDHVKLMSGFERFDNEVNSSGDLMSKNENDGCVDIDHVKQMSGVDQFDNEVTSKGDFMSKYENQSDGFVSTGQVKQMLDAGRFGERVLEKEGDFKNSGLDSSPGEVKKGKGLRKWRRIKREVTEEGCVIVDGSRLSKRGFSNTGGQGKVMQVSSEMRQSSEGSLSSTRALVRLLEGYAAVCDSGQAHGPFFVTRADSENSDDRSSKSSTAASMPKMRNGGSVATGRVNDRNKIAKNVEGKKSGSSVQKVPQGKAQREVSKKSRGEQVNIEKEPSHSSMESDSRSVNCVSMQGSRSVTSSGRRNGGSMNYGGQNGSENPRQVTQQLRSGDGKNSDGESEDVSQEDVNAGSSWSVKEENSENQEGSTDQDDPIESVHMLQSVQEAIEKEIQKFREMGMEDNHVDDSIQDWSLPLELISDGLEVNGSGGDRHTLESEVSSLKENVHVMEIKLEETTTMLKMKEGKISELEGRLGSRTTHPLHLELEALFKQKIEADIEYLTISKTIQDLRVASVDQISQLEERIVSERSQIMNKLIDAETKAVNLKTDAKQLEKHCEDVLIADKTIKLQSRACKYTTCFLIQFVLLLVMLLFLVSKSPPDFTEDVLVPT